MPIIVSSLELSRKDLIQMKVTDQYSLHRIVYSLFEDVRTEAEKRAGAKSSGILYAEAGDTPAAKSIIILSNRHPVENGFGRLRSRHLDETFLEHQAYTFKVAINPIKRNGRKAIPIRGVSNVTSWFIETSLKSWGFRVDPHSLSVGPINIEQFKNKHKDTVTLAKSVITGSLVVTDQEMFKKCVKHGIGHGRSFGCGLLQVLPITPNPFSI